MKKSSKEKLCLLKIVIVDHPLFKSNTEFSLINQSKVTPNNSAHLTPLINNIWSNNLIAIAGINATGKTMLMKTIIGLLELILGNKSIDQTPLRHVLFGNKPISFEIYFLSSNQKVYKDRIQFSKISNSFKWYISSERIFGKKVGKTIAKKKIFTFEDKNLFLDRNKLSNEASALLAKDDSIFRIIINRQNYSTQMILDTLSTTDYNFLMPFDNIPKEIITFLDPSIEFFRVKKVKDSEGKVTTIYCLKFKNSNEIVVNSFAPLQNFLSSGTIKGITLYGALLSILKLGGIAFIDELEIHFNHTIVRSFIDFFANPKINIHHATLIFSTHYSELLSDLPRGDEIYLTSRNPQNNKIELRRYSNTKVRSDLDKADVIDSNYLGGTAPKYETYMALKKATKEAVNGK